MLGEKIMPDIDEINKEPKSRQRPSRRRSSSGCGSTLRERLSPAEEFDAVLRPRGRLICCGLAGVADEGGAGVVVGERRRGSGWGRPGRHW
jgi:hypothetical protein